MDPFSPAINGGSTPGTGGVGTSPVPFSSQPASLSLLASFWQSAVKQGAPALPRESSTNPDNLEPLPANPTRIETQGHPEVPSAIITGTAAAIVALGPQKVWFAGKWIFRNVLVGASIAEASSWYVAFQTDLFKAGTYSHDIQNYLLGLPSNQPLLTQDYTFLQRLLNDLPSVTEQRRLAQHFLEEPLADLIAERDQLLSQNSLAAQEVALLASRLIDLRLEQQRNQIINQNAITASALAVAAALGHAALVLFAAGQQPDSPRVPAGSADP